MKLHNRNKKFFNLFYLQDNENRAFHGLVDTQLDIVENKLSKGEKLESTLSPEFLKGLSNNVLKLYDAKYPIPTILKRLEYIINHNGVKGDSLQTYKIPPNPTREELVKALTQITKIQIASLEAKPQQTIMKEAPKIQPNPNRTEIQNNQPLSTNRPPLIIYQEYTVNEFYKAFDLGLSGVLSEEELKAGLKIQPQTVPSSEGLGAGKEFMEIYITPDNANNAGIEIKGSVSGDGKDWYRDKARKDEQNPLSNYYKNDVPVTFNIKLVGPDGREYIKPLTIEFGQNPKLKTFENILRNGQNPLQSLNKKTIINKSKSDLELAQNLWGNKIFGLSDTFFSGREAQMFEILDTDNVYEKNGHGKINVENMLGNKGQIGYTLEINPESKELIKKGKLDKLSFPIPVKDPYGNMHIKDFEINFSNGSNNNTNQTVETPLNQNQNLDTKRPPRILYTSLETVDKIGVVGSLSPEEVAAGLRIPHQNIYSKEEKSRNNPYMGLKVSPDNGQNPVLNFNVIVHDEEWFKKASNNYTSFVRTTFDMQIVGPDGKSYIKPITLDISPDPGRRQFDANTQNGIDSLSSLKLPSIDYRSKNILEKAQRPLGNNIWNISSTFFNGEEAKMFKIPQETQVIQEQSGYGKIDVHGDPNYPNQIFLNMQVNEDAKERVKRGEIKKFVFPVEVVDPYGNKHKKDYEINFTK